METAQDFEGLPTGEHIEINEDGRRTVHPGYAIVYCRICNKPFIIAKDRIGGTDLCGRERCLVAAKRI